MDIVWEFLFIFFSIDFLSIIVRKIDGLNVVMVVVFFGYMEIVWEFFFVFKNIDFFSFFEIYYDCDDVGRNLILIVEYYGCVKIK